MALISQRTTKRNPEKYVSFPLLVGMSLWLESYAAAVLAIIPFSTLVLRIRIEEKLLIQGLKGYEEYTTRVRYRLIPFLW